MNLELKHKSKDLEIYDLVHSGPTFWCCIGLHDYTKWEDKGEIEPFGSSYHKILQERRCKDCNLVQLRESFA